MYHRQNFNNQKPYQMMDFSSFRKKNNQSIARYQNNKIIISSVNQSHILTILAFFQLTSNVLINDQIFDKINFDQSPKVFQTYTSQKTMKHLLKVIVDKIDSPNSLAQLIDQFPIVSFVLESYSRAICINFIRNNKEIQLFGNQQLVLQDFSCDIRGPLLNIMADSYGAFINLKIGEVHQTYGQQKNQKKINISLSQSGIEGQIVQKRGNIPTSANKVYPNSGTKTLKQPTSKQTQTSQGAQTTIGENSSLLRQSMVTDSGRCEKCKLVKGRCVCSKKVYNSPYNTPKSGAKNQKNPVSSLNIGLNVINQGKCTCNKIFCICRR